MARRMEIELTSSRDEETFTWRAAGAREPRGTISKSLLSATARPGDVVRVETDFDLDGIVVTAVLPSKTRSPAPDRIEIKAPRTGQEGGVTTTLVEKRGRRTGPPSGRDGGDRGRGDRSRNERPSRARSERPDRSEGAESRRVRPAASRPGERPGPDETRTPRRTRPARLVFGTKHRDELFATLAPEQRAIAEQLAVGGLPAVRRALESEQRSAREAGRPAVGGEAIIALAEQLLPSVREATWLDRAEAVSGQLETVSLRDLRATVVGAAPRDDAGRELLRGLREKLDERVNKLRATWEQEMTHALEEKRVLQALRLSARPPEPTARFPAALVQPLAEAAGAALAADTPAERFLALLEAAAASPIRRTIKPAGIPEDPTGEVRKHAALAAGRIPALARLLGLAMPPPPGPMPSIATRRPRPVGARRVPPPPSDTRPGTEAVVAEPATAEATDTEPAGTEPADTQPTGAEPAGAETAIAADASTEPIEAEVTTTGAPGQVTAEDVREPDDTEHREP